MELKNYLDDGANRQARAVLMYLQQNDGIEESWSDVQKRYLADVKLCRWENGREQGYTLSLPSKDYKRQLNIIFYEHRNSDNICAVKWEQVSYNSISTFEQANFGEEIYKTKWDVSFEVGYGECIKMANWIWKELTNFWLETSEEN